MESTVSQSALECSALLRPLKLKMDQSPVQCASTVQSSASAILVHARMEWVSGNAVEDQSWSSRTGSDLATFLGCMESIFFKTQETREENERRKISETKIKIETKHILKGLTDALLHPYLKIQFLMHDNLNAI